MITVSNIALLSLIRSSPRQDILSQQDILSCNKCFGSIFVYYKIAWHFTVELRLTSIYALGFHLGNFLLNRMRIILHKLSPLALLKRILRAHLLNMNIKNSESVKFLNE